MVSIHCHTVAVVALVFLMQTCPWARVSPWGGAGRRCAFHICTWISVFRRCVFVARKSVSPIREEHTPTPVYASALSAAKRHVIHLFIFRLME